MDIEVRAVLFARELGRWRHRPTSQVEEKVGRDWKYRSSTKKGRPKGGQFRISDVDGLIRAVRSLGSSTTARIVIGRRCGSGGARLRGLHHDRSRGSRCRASHDRTSHTAHGGPNWPTYDGSSYGTARCAG